MNKHILMVIDHQLNPDKYTQKQLEENWLTASAAAHAVTTAADEHYVTAAAASFEPTSVFWINEYFEESGENKQDYIDAINKEAQS